MAINDMPDLNKPVNNQGYPGRFYRWPSQRMTIPDQNRQIVRLAYTLNTRPTTVNFDRSSMTGITLEVTASHTDALDGVATPPAVSAVPVIWVPISSPAQMNEFLNPLTAIRVTNTSGTDLNLDVLA